MKILRRMAIIGVALLTLTTGVWAAEAPQASAEAPEFVELPAAEPEESALRRPAEEDLWKLLLVNPWNKLPEQYTVKLKRLANGLQVDVRIYDDLNAMLTDCWDAGLKPLVCSAYRTHATQVRLHNNKIARLRGAGYSYAAAVKEAGRWVAVPGTSEHETGMALDIASYSYQLLNERQENTAEQKWLMEHCWEYGFILRYPKDKTEITGIGYEPWHYRYVGREAAAEMHESGLCLEEYLAALKAEADAAAAKAAEAVVETEAAVEAQDSARQTQS